MASILCGHRQSPPQAADERLHVDLPDLFAFQDDDTRARLTSRRPDPALERDESPAAPARGRILLVEGDDEVCRLVSRLLGHEGYQVLTASCLAEARVRLQEERVDHLIARRESVPANANTDLILRDLRSQTDVRIVDTFSALMLGQVVDYETMCGCYLPLLDLLMSLREGGNVSARGHSHNVARYSRLVGQRIGMSRRDLNELTLAAYLHELGPLETAGQISSVLVTEKGLAPPALQPTLDVLTNISFPYNVNEVIAAAEKGSTDPDSPAPLGARILRIVDTYDTLRRFDPNFSDEERLFTWMRHQPPGTFDPAALEVFIHMRRHERTINAMEIFSASILLADPHPEELQLLRLRLENDDCRVHLASSVEEALQLLRTHTINLVLSERTLRGPGTGFDLLRALKNDPDLRRISFVFHAAGDAGLIVEALGLGADDWFPKPYNVEIMTLKLNRLINRRRVEPAAQGGTQGNVRDVGLMELVQILAAACRSVEIAIEHKGLSAKLVLHQGRVRHAMYGQLAGDRAAIESLLIEDGHFRLIPLGQAPATNITMSTDNLIMQSCYEKDSRAAGPSAVADQ